MNDRLLALRLFTRVARTESFSRAGRELGLSQPSASRIVAALEHDVGATLFVRTTRAVTLTDAGADYLARIEPILAALEEADHAARGTGELRGLLRIALSSSFGVRVVIPRLPDFLARHPALRVEFLMNDAREDLVSEGIDVALRFGGLIDSTAVARRLVKVARLLTASPDYLSRAGLLEQPSDLADHSLIIGPGGRASDIWSFERDGRRVSVRAEGRLAVSVNEGAVAAATAGLGIVMTSAWGCAAELNSGKLVQVLIDWLLEPAEIHAVFPAGRAAGPAARAFVDFLADALHQTPAGAA